MMMLLWNRFIIVFFLSFLEDALQSKQCKHVFAKESKSTAPTFLLQ